MSEDDKGSKMHGGLLKHKGKKKKTIDERGHVTIEHWDGRQDVVINASKANARAEAHRPQGKDR